MFSYIGLQSEQLQKSFNKLVGPMNENYSQFLELGTRTKPPSRQIYVNITIDTSQILKSVDRLLSHDLFRKERDITNESEVVDTKLIEGRA